MPPPSAARRTVTIRGHVPPPPAPAAAPDDRAGDERGSRSRAPRFGAADDAPRALGLSVLTPAGESTRPVRPHVDAALARLAAPRPAPRSAPGAPPAARGHSVTLAYRRRPPRPLLERLGSSPDRLAMWAVVMGVFLVLVAALSAHA